MYGAVVEDLPDAAWEAFEEMDHPPRSTEDGALGYVVAVLGDASEHDGAMEVMQATPISSLDCTEAHARYEELRETVSRHGVALPGGVLLFSEVETA